MRRLHIAICALITVAAATRALAVTISIDYSNDTFFASHPVAKATLEMAAADVGSLLLGPLGQVTDISTGTAPDGSSAMFDFRVQYTNPTTGANQTFNPVEVPAGQVTIFAGMRPLAAGTLGIGGTGAAGYNGSGNPVTLPGFTTAVHNAEAAANSNMGRGGGPVINQFNGKFTVTSNGNSTDIPYTINVGSTIGSLTFDNDTNNDNVIDDDTRLNNYWQFDGTAPVPAKKFDFYSVAVHEILHALDFGNTLSPSWTSKVSATDSRDWTGSQVMSLVGSGDNVLEADSAHIASGFVSTRLSDGKAQEAAMDPSLTNGARKKITRLDLAFLRDMGWQTVPYPLLVGDLDQNNRRTIADVQVLMTALTNLNAYQSSNGFSNSDLLTVASVNGDNAVTNTDLEALLVMLANDIQPPVLPVPEPGDCCLALSAGAILTLTLGRRRPRSSPWPALP